MVRVIMRPTRVVSHTVVYMREPHGFRERWHRLDALSRSVGWMDKYLGGR